MTMIEPQICQRRKTLGQIPYDDIRKIVIVKTILDCGSMQKAAKQLKVTPSAISQSLSALEKKIGAPLFVRDAGKITATEACLALVLKAEPALQALHTLFQEQNESLRIDYLDLGAYESLAHSVLSDFTSELRRSHPKVKFSIIVNRTAELLKKLRSGEICTALIAETDGIDRIRLEQVGQDELGLFVSKIHSPRIDDWGFIESLGFGMITTASDGIPGYLKKFTKQMGSRPPVTISSDSYEVLRRAAVNGLCASVLPKRVAQRSKLDLTEVTQFQGQARSETGLHSIFLASMDRCDEDESKFLAAIARRCFARESNV